jgi:hypothetical protein
MAKAGSSPDGSMVARQTGRQVVASGGLPDGTRTRLMQRLQDLAFENRTPDPRRKENWMADVAPAMKVTGAPRAR